LFLSWPFLQIVLLFPSLIRDGYDQEATAIRLENQDNYFHISDDRLMVLGGSGNFAPVIRGGNFLVMMGTQEESQRSQEV
jgi:hypothetical protein